MMSALRVVCVQVKQRQDEEKRQLCALRDQLRPVVHTEQVRDAASQTNIIIRFNR